jgi:shikimate kinase
MAVPTPTRVVLLGLMGSGKTTVGRLLAERTGWPYLDNDDLLRELTGRSLNENADVGADALHELERQVVRDVLHRPPPFVAGAAAAVIEDPTIVDLLHTQSFAVYLHAPPEVLVARIGDDVNRPWLRPDPLAALEKMYLERDPLFRKAAAYVADATRPPEEVAARIYAELPRPM